MKKTSHTYCRQAIQKQFAIALGITATFIFFFNGTAVFGQSLVTNRGAQITINDGAVVIVRTNSVDNADGRIDNAGNFIIEDDYINGDLSTGNASSTGVYDVGGNWINNAVFTADQSEVILSGTNQLITGSSITQFYNLNLKGTGIKTQTLNAFVTNILELNDRELATDANSMFVTNPATGAISRTSGFVSSEGNGQLTREMNQIFPYLYPVGSSNGTVRYRPVRIQPNNAGTYQYGVRMANVDATSEGFDRADRDSEICNVNPLFYHRVYRNAGNGPVDLRFFYDPFTDGSWETNAHWQNVPQWEKTPNISTGSPSPFNVVRTLGWTDFSSPAFALANLLPIIDSSLLVIDDEYCSNTMGAVKNLSVANLIPGTTIIWTNAAGNIVGTDLTLSDVPAGTYTLTITKPNGCSEDATFTIDFIPPFTQSISTVDVLCTGDATGSANLTINSGGFPPFSYAWSNGTTTQDLNDVKAGSYSVTITDARGCEMNENIFINEPDSAIFIWKSVTPESCERSNGTASVIVRGGTPPYTYIWDSNPAQFGPNATSLSAGTYTAVITDDHGCIETKTITIENIPTPTAVFEGNPNPETPVLLSQATFFFTNLSLDAVRYEWNFGDGNFSDVANPSHTYQDTGAYMVTLTAYNEVGCSDQFIAGPFIVIPDGTLYIPNAFSPNSDGHNDYFGVKGEGVVHFRMVIFSRWGEEIVTLNSISERWDGTYKGVAVPEGVYSYIMDARTNGNEEFNRGGTITLLR